MLYNFLIIKHIRNKEYLITVDTFYAMTTSFPILLMTTASLYRTITWTWKFAVLLAFGLYLKITCFGSLVTLSA